MSDRTLNRISESDTSTESHVRTYVRTEKSGADVGHLTAVDARRSNERMATIGEVIAGGILPDGSRHEVVRFGERTPIPHWVRAAVWYRDGGRCELCATRSKASPWELDHVIPWSAGGPDDTTNLRVLCGPHNQQRSNYVDPNERPRRPATWWCSRCYMLDEHGWRYDRGPIPACPIHAHDGWTFGDKIPKRCSVMRNYEHAITTLGEHPMWHKRIRQIVPEDLCVVAYCAHCGLPGLTDLPL